MEFYLDTLTNYLVYLFYKKEKNWYKIFFKILFELQNSKKDQKFIGICWSLYKNCDKNSKNNLILIKTKKGWKNKSREKKHECEKLKKS